MEKTSQKAKIPALFTAPFRVGLVAQLWGSLAKEVALLGFKEAGYSLEPTDQADHGDYTTNAAMVLFAQATPEQKKEWQNPRGLAERLKTGLEKGMADLVEKVEVAGPGFVNISLKNELLISSMMRVITEKEKFGTSEFLKDKTILLEHTSPDPIKTIHIGHLRNNFLGMAFGRLFQAHGANVCLDCVNNDRGTHVCRAMLGYLAFARKSLSWPREDLLEFKVPEEAVKKVASEINWRELLDGWLTKPTDWWQPEELNLKSDHLNLVFYSLGDRAERLVETVGPQVREMLQAWEAEEGKVWALWRQIIDWSLRGYEATYERIGSQHDKVWSESNLYKGGKQLVQEGLGKGAFVESKGAVVTKLEEYGLPDTVAIKSDGTSLYLTFDLNLTKKKREFLPADLYVWDIGNDQLLYLRQLFAVCEQLGLGSREDYFHLNYGYVSLAGGEKMSSRAGTVIVADNLLDELKARALKLVQTSKTGQETEATEEEKKKQEELADSIGQAALKYALMRTGRNSGVKFDAEASVSLSGDCGPYLQYTHARTLSVVRKALASGAIYSLNPFDLMQGRLSGVIKPARGGGLPMAGLGGRSPMAPSGFGGLPKMGAPTLSGAPKTVFGQAEPEPKKKLECNPEERGLLVLLSRYPEIVLKTVTEMETAPLCGYLYELASTFNQLYNQHKILELPKKEEKAPAPARPKVDHLRLGLAAATAQILANGLGLLGIDAPEKM